MHQQAGSSQCDSSASGVKQPRVALIGPILPFRGGIAQHTTMLHRALRAKSNLITLSYSRQYPAWLFPGESDRDPDYVGYAEPGVAYIIDSLNPMTWRHACQHIQDHGTQIAIIPWWTVYWAFFSRYLASSLKRSGIKVVVLCHNVVEHESAAWKRWLTKIVLHSADRFVVHTQQDEKNLLALVPNGRARIHPHPIYSQFPFPDERLPRRAALELLFFGFVRPYKGLDVLLDASALIADRDFMLTIAGEFWAGEESTQRKINELGLSNHVELRPRYHTDQETAQLFDRADCVVLPYRSATGTGIIPIAYHYNKPVVVTRVGGLPEVVEDGATGFIVEPESPQLMADAIQRCESFRPSASAFDAMKQRMSWESMAETLLRS